ncbi:hypothetical protein MPUL_22300 [Mycolicibacterium pulveris]|uniref:4Fe-4S Mo/W bis-MGD-type domain-containing protein n=1 Tax=Mycolicibacterium pulveris TaxID=36813 RepID=A0A7I7UI78_MYCPV|nr:hypothetical protein MPUL_22300 [Mycolicibacterium pulveris]
MTAELSRPVAGVGEDGRHLYTCPLCEAMCGLEIQVEGGRVAGIRGNRDDTWSRGHLCPKGVNTNVLSPPTFFDEPSGNGALNGIPVTVSAAAT